MPKPVILCVDDEKTVLISLRQELEFGLGEQYGFELAESAEEGIEILEDLQGSTTPVALVITDQIMPGMKGDEFLNEVARRWPSVGRLLLTGESGYSTNAHSPNFSRLFVTMAKPWDLHELRRTVLECSKAAV